MTNADYEFFLKKDLTEYAGKWIAIAHQKIIENDADLTRLLSKVKKNHKGYTPMFTKIPEANAILIL